MQGARLLFVTGKLAEPALRRILPDVSRQADFEYDVRVLKISVAALIRADWLLKNLGEFHDFDRVILPGWCEGNLEPLSDRFGTPFALGPKDLYDLGEYFGTESHRTVDLSQYDIEILAEINHAPRLSDTAILEQAESYRNSGADVIDLGCIPGESWSRAGDVTRLLRADGHRVSIDTFERREVERAVEAGAELVLSCNSSNVDWLTDVDAELVAIPDETGELSTLETTINRLSGRSRGYRIDPILEPIGFGFTASLERFFEARRRWPDAEIMMGIGNVTELTDVDTAGVNVILASLCQELGIHSVLTTQVINWARTAVGEFDLARRLVYHSINNRVLPKHVSSELVMLRDTKLRNMNQDELDALAARLTDPNFRIFAENGEIHVMSRDGHWQGRDPYELIDHVEAEAGPLDPSHAFYLGYEISKAITALTLGKQYTQDEPLRWGMLTVDETSAVERRKHRK